MRRSLGLLRAMMGFRQAGMDKQGLSLPNALLNVEAVRAESLSFKLYFLGNVVSKCPYHAQEHEDAHLNEGIWEYLPSNKYTSNASVWSISRPESHQPSVVYRNTRAPRMLNTNTGNPCPQTPSSLRTARPTPARTGSWPARCSGRPGRCAARTASGGRRRRR